MVHFYKDNKRVISGKYHKGVYYLQRTIAKSKKNMPRVEKIIKKKTSKTVTFAKVLIQGPTLYGFETKDSSAQGGDSFLTEKSEEIESKVSSEESQKTESSTDDVLSGKEVRHKDGDLLAHVLTAPKELSTKEESKDYEEDWKKAGKREYVNTRLGNGVVRKVSHILGEGIFGDRVKENITLSKNHSNENRAGVLINAVPGEELQVRCDSA